MLLDYSTLNPEQAEAVLHKDGPLLVLAGAGSGKTRVITYRLGHLIANGVAAKNILCVTFTNKAAAEMRHRARALAGRSVRGTTMSTFHALGSRILREHPAEVGLKKGFTISDGGEQIGFLRRILRSLRIDDRKFDAKRIQSMISMAKNAGVDAATYRAQRGHLVNTPEGPLEPPGDGASDEEYTVAAIEAYERYELGLRAQNVVDFDDLLLMTVMLLNREPAILERLRDRWRYLMVDEYQDTNGAQFELMRLLTGDRRNLCVVGDDDQSIYGWRGADITNILRFEKLFPGAKVIKLELNYRSTGSILTVANSVIEKNTQRHDKTLRAFAGPGDPVRIIALEEEEEEAEQVAGAVGDLLAGAVLGKDVAVLFRSNVQSRPIELAFRTEGIPYRVAGGQALFDKREVKDVLAYLRVLDNPDDEQALRRIINYPPRGIGDTTVKRIDDWAREQNLPLSEGLAQPYEVPSVKERAADAITVFNELMAEHRKLLGRRKVSTVAKTLFEQIGIEEVLFGSSDNAITASRRVDNVRHIVKQIERFEKRIAAKRRSDPEVEPADLTGFLSDLALSARDETDNNKDDRDHEVVLSTIHAAKGLEWTTVFVVGAEEELLPHARTIDGDGEIEEERRLAYVAITRAREQLTITWARSRTRWGRIVPRLRSRFLEELPEDCVLITEDRVAVERSDDEKEAIAEHHMDAIRKQLGL